MTHSLINCGFRQIKKDKNNLGLSVVLGGCGTSLEELCNLYAAFANSGKYVKSKYVIDTITVNEKEILSEASAYMISEILSQLVRPDLQMQWQNSPNLPRIAWKTGTSYGRRDAWSIGYNNDYTIGVWAGNFSGVGIPALSGATLATPLLFKIFNSIDSNSKTGWDISSANTDFRLVCSKTGNIPSHFCSNQIIDSYIPEVSNNIRCTHKKYVFISPDSSISYCSTCLPETGYIKALYPDHSPEYINYMESNHINYIKIPKHNPNCEKVFEENAPQIVSPFDMGEYFINKNDTLQMKLACYTSSDVEKVFWYINEVFYKSSVSGKGIFFQPPEGKVKISCSDDKGRNSNIIITTKYIEF